jgi:hypothetical protein
MTKVDFIKEWGADWRKLSTKPIFAALLSVIDDESPSRALAVRSDADVLHGGPVLAAEIRGHERLRAFLISLSDENIKQFEADDKFVDSEKI